LIIKRTLLVLLLGAAGYGCASPQSVKPEQGATFVIDNRSYSDVWNAALQAVVSVADIKSMDKAKGEIRALRSPTNWRGAEVIAVFIAPTNEASPHFTVSVVSEHALRTQLLGRGFKDTIISQMEKQLEIPPSLSSTAEGPP
jgi:hypothetical protein